MSKHPTETSPAAGTGGGSIECTPASVRLRGEWKIPGIPALERSVDTLTWPSAKGWSVDTSGITALDSAGAVLLLRLQEHALRQGAQAVEPALGADSAALLAMVRAQLAAAATAVIDPAPLLLERIGLAAVAQWAQAVRALGFLGEATTALGRALAHPRGIRGRALVASLEIDGVRALPIIGLLAFLMGVVIAYQGAEQLRKFGTNIFVVDLVGISILREIAPLVTAILVAGRSGSAYAAQIGTMKVTEELDALRTLGLSPMDLLVIPKIFALAMALPLMTVLADALGVFGGMLIALTQLNVTFTEFVARFEEAVALKHFLIGVAKAPVFAAIIVLVGCYQGFQIRGGVDDVGRRTTVSVVQSIFLVIVFDAFFSVVLSWWDV